MGINQKRREEIEKILSKENLEKALQQYSANYIATKLFLPFKTTAGVVIDRAKAFGLITHSISESHKLKHTTEARLKTIRTKYGVDNPSQSQEIKNKKEQKAIAKYGVKNVFQAQEIKDKSKLTMMEKYGVEHSGGCLGSKNNGKLSKFHQEIEKLLKKNEISYQSEVCGKFIKYSKTKQKNYSPVVDILIEDSKLVIECNGDFWHANPNKYKDKDIFYTWEGKKTAKDIWKHDKMRTSHIESFGYKVLVIWESDFNHNKQNIEKVILDAIANRFN